jgi:RecT family
MPDEQPQPVVEEGMELAATEKKKAADLIKFGAMPETLGAAWLMANIYAKSEMIPKDYRGRPHDILAVWDMASRFGFGPLQALQTIANINGRPGVWGDGVLAICQSSPKYRDHDEYFLVGGKRREVHEGLSNAELQQDDTKGVSLFYVKDREKPYGESFSIADAKRAGLTNKRDTPWQTYPARMLIWRARGFSARDAFPAELRGLKSAEELRDYPDIDVSVSRVEDVPEPQRKSEQTPAPTNGTPVGPSPDPATPAPVPTPEPDPTPAGPATPAASRFGIGQVIVSEGKVLDTAFVPDKSGPGSSILPLDPGAVAIPPGVYEVRAEIRSGPKARPEKVVFLTDLQALYENAESCGGTDTPLKFTWGTAKHQGKTVRVLTGLEGL